MARFVQETLKTAATVLILGLAVLAALVIWDFYVTAPWTRDGSVRVQVASIAPEVSGQITEVRVVDNQFVHQGDVLYVIDPFDFQVALDTAKAQLQKKAADLQVKRQQAERQLHLDDLATTAEQQQLFVGNATQAQAAFDAAQQQLAQADINLKRTRV
ncbi:MAG TPA: biotin/lipoyl-binding protein, partial [Stellaceae bacterium]|nr:biotin/lipoyl-binding protein [Stellaceae bacterium]